MNMVIHFGAMAKPLHEQLDLRPNAVKGFQAQVDAVALLYLKGVLNDRERNVVYDRIGKKLKKFLQREHAVSKG
jgi:hypothetical protein